MNKAGLGPCVQLCNPATLQPPYGPCTKLFLLQRPRLPSPLNR
jgi:hypothetical protein